MSHTELNLKKFSKWQWFRYEVSKAEEEMPDDVLNLLLGLVDPLHDAHTTLLRDVEERLAVWEGRCNVHLKSDHQRIGDVLLKNLMILPVIDLFECTKVDTIPQFQEITVYLLNILKFCHILLNFFVCSCANCIE